jgi:hypothetical protein
MSESVTALVLAVIFGVAALDVVVGLWLLASPRPFDVNGARTLWASSGPGAFSADPALARSLFSRLGAFSLHTGVATTVWALSTLERPDLRLVLLLTYALTGAAFLHGDRRDFAGTRYFAMKQGIGVLWSAALIAQIVLVARG